MASGSTDPEAAFAALAAAVGVQSTAQTADESTQKIFRGSRPTSVGRGPSILPVSRVPEEGFQRSRVVGPVATMADEWSDYKDELVRWFTMSSAERSKIQEEFVRQGLYGDQKPKLGDQTDSVGFQAWSKAVDQTRHLNFLGQRVTTEDVVKAAPTDVAGQGQRSTTDLLSRWYSMSAEERSKIQTQMFVAGLYGGADANSVPYGMASDAQGFSAWSKLVQQAVASTTAGVPKSPEDFLTEQYNAGLSNPAAAPKLEVTDPASIAQSANDVAQRVLGRKATPAEQRVLIAMIHQQQTSAQLAKSGTVSSPDITAEAEQQLRTANPGEAGAHDFASTFSGFLGMLQGVR